MVPDTNSLTKQHEKPFPKSLQSILNGLPSQIKFVSEPTNISNPEFIQVYLRDSSDNRLGKVIIERTNGNITFKSGNGDQGVKWFEIYNTLEHPRVGVRTFRVYTSTNGLKLGSMIEPIIKKGRITNAKHVLINNDYEKDAYSIVVVNSEDIIWINRSDGSSICSVKLQRSDNPAKPSSWFSLQYTLQYSNIFIPNMIVAFSTPAQGNTKPISVVEKCLCLSTAFIFMMGGKNHNTRKSPEPGVVERTRFETIIEQPPLQDPIIEQPAPEPIIVQAPPDPIIEPPPPVTIIEPPLADPIIEQVPEPVVEQPTPEPVKQQPPKRVRKPSIDRLKLQPLERGENEKLVTQVLKEIRDGFSSQGGKQFPDQRGKLRSMSLK